MANDIKSAELCLNAVQALENQLRGARKTLINSETCIVNRGIMTAQLEYLRDNLPQTVSQELDDVRYTHEIYSLQGLYLIAEAASSFQESNPELTVSGIIITRHNDRSSLARQMKDNIVREAAELHIPFLGAIREAVAIREAQALQANLYEYAPKSKPALDYLEIYRKLI